MQTGAAASIAEHPIGLLSELRFRVTVNTDNRLMSGTSMSREMAALVDAFGWDLDDLRWVTVNAMKSAFSHFDQRLRIIDEVIKPGYAALGPSRRDPRPMRASTPGPVGRLLSAHRGDPSRAVERPDVSRLPRARRPPSRQESSLELLGGLAAGRLVAATPRLPARPARRRPHVVVDAPGCKLPS